jgi:hypothetical protein
VRRTRRAATGSGARLQTRGRGRHRAEYRRDGRDLAAARADGGASSGPPWPSWRGAARRSGAFCSPG